MADPLEHVSPGDPLTISAATWNRVIDGTRQLANTPRTPRGAGAKDSTAYPPATFVLVKNTSGSGLARRSILTPSGVVVDPDASPIEAANGPAFLVSAPVTDADPVLILLDPVPNNGLAFAAASGVTVASVVVSDTAHTHARPSPGNLSNLVSAASGPVRLLQTFGSTGSHVCYVLLQGDMGAGGDGAVLQAYTATTAALPAVTYDNGAFGVGATLTATANGALPTVGGVSVPVGKTILVKNQANEWENGPYVFTSDGDGSSPFVLTRHPDADEPDEVFEALVRVSRGSSSVERIADTIWMTSAEDPITVGATDLPWFDVSGNVTYPYFTTPVYSGSPSPYLHVGEIPNFRNTNGKVIGGTGLSAGVAPGLYSCTLNYGDEVGDYTKGRAHLSVRRYGSESSTRRHSAVALYTDADTGLVLESVATNRGDAGGDQDCNEVNVTVNFADAVGALYLRPGTTDPDKVGWQFYNVDYFTIDGEQVLTDPGNGLAGGSYP